jgi:hypothetical protein
MRLLFTKVCGNKSNYLPDHPSLDRLQVRSVSEHMSPDSHMSSSSLVWSFSNSSPSQVTTHTQAWKVSQHIVRVVEQRKITQLHCPVYRPLGNFIEHQCLRVPEGGTHAAAYAIEITARCRVPWPCCGPVSTELTRFRRRPSTESRRCRLRPEACGGGGGRP